MLDGYVVKEGIYAVCLFSAGDEFYFNRYLTGMAADEARKLKKKLGEAVGTIFLLEFETEFQQYL